MTTQQVLIKRSFRQISDLVEKSYENFVLEKVNDHCLRMAVMTGEYRWHYHAYTDELFLVLEGELKIETKDQGDLYLHAGDFIKVPAGIVHKTSAIGRTVNLCFEKNADDTIFVD